MLDNQLAGNVSSKNTSGWINSLCLQLTEQYPDKLSSIMNEVLTTGLVHMKKERAVDLSHRWVAHKMKEIDRDLVLYMC